MRIGQSQDTHKLVEGRDLFIGGVKIPYEKGLLGHSDADVLLHAIIESIIGAMGLRDIGTHFSDKDPKYEGISSLKLLEATYEMMCKEGYKIVNVDSLIIIERPKMAPYIDEMRKNIAEALHTDIKNINVKATCSEKMGFIGRGEGAVAQAVCLIDNI
ncbi:MAG: 2-C-methyl-D-erythritol 2,4-cyclodiphosphate synthase [Solobacterium sp.]|nr:2-C-methyl-D-erythritol 2,4-cyclodiphosphate synthase [Solobacterium sp.]MDY2730823.1 2-C-methyl-D-erythritol 2,4-cyclodiphosphate synthase [Erysipelotrichaceae bacterium]MDD5982289.1 2-C-methyl-D-erythritol 2,4-cyclodiphosphate synthase [Solobacterium sp.]MDD6122598.1 2-C-methyl-D-erythritol 2,4-cyclodiphosphate synthase [Solobacterium sp.]MDD6498106.1 2-C-methyl-D-erythritol 2,4-cyclodiphosphate synthase [Solobacterium sp.]